MSPRRPPDSNSALAFPSQGGEVDPSAPMVCKSGELFVATKGRFIATLGSCIAVILRDRRTGLAGINHFLLPDRSVASADTNLGSLSFGEESTRQLLRQMKEQGCHRSDLDVWLVGGGNLMQSQDVGRLNLLAAEKVLASVGLTVRDRNVGGMFGRRLEFLIESGQLTVWVLDSKQNAEPAEPKETKQQRTTAALLRRFATKPPHLIAIGSSTGGVEVVKDLLLGHGPNLPPVVVVQHMPPMFTGEFAKRLDSLTGLRVKEAVLGEPLRRGHVYLAPGGRQMGIRAGKTTLGLDVNDDAPVDLFKPSVNYLFRSIVTGGLSANTFAILLTGMGSDGASGMVDLRRGQAATVTQSESSCLVYGMPRAADDMGASMASLTPQQIHQILNKLSQG